MGFASNELGELFQWLGGCQFTLGMVPITNGKRRSDASRRRRPESDKDGVQRSWADLNPDLLFVILMKLGVIDFIAFGGVCSEWRKLSLRHREIFLNSKEPFVITIPQRSKKACILYSPFDRRGYRTMLPSFPGKIFAGLSCGYLIFFKRKPTTFCVFNLITRHELYFPPLPMNIDLTLPDFHAIVLFSPCLSDYELVVLDKEHKRIMSCQAGNDASKWKASSFAESLLEFVDLHVFKGRLYLVNIDGRVGVMRLNPIHHLKLLRVKSLRTFWGNYLQLFSSEEKLFLVKLSSPQEGFSCELDFVKGEWVEGDFEEYVFFANSLKGSGTLNLDKWKGPKPELFSRAVFLIPRPHFYPRREILYWYRRRPNHEGIFQINLPEDHAKTWYFPNTCYRTDVLDDSTQYFPDNCYPENVLEDIKLT